MVEDIINSFPYCDRLKDKIIVITGKNGFMASWLIKLFKKLNCKVIGIGKEDWNLIDKIDKADYIFHAASNATPVKFKTNPVDTMLPNIIGTKILLDLAIKTKAIFIFFSTTGVYGWSNNYPISENEFGKLNCMLPESCYLESKRAGEALCVAYCEQYKVEIRILRLGICYGHGMKLDDGRVMNTFLKNVLNKENLNVYNGNFSRSFMYITDIISAILYVLINGKNEAYNIASEREITIHQLAQLLKNMYPESRIEYKDDMKHKRSSMDFQQTWMNIAKLKSFGWQQKVTLKEGLKRTINEYRRSQEFN